MRVINLLNFTALTLEGKKGNPYILLVLISIHSAATTHVRRTHESGSFCVIFIINTHLGAKIYELGGFSEMTENVRVKRVVHLWRRTYFAAIKEWEPVIRSEITT